MKQWDIIVVGGGAAGLMAAGQAAAQGASVLILEKMKRPGRKICISGKGRCNLTNTAQVSDFISHFGKNGRFLHQAFCRFFSQELIDFFNREGLKVVKERGGRVFPASGKAPDVLKTLQRWLKRSGVRIECGGRIDTLSEQNGKITGVQIKEKQYSGKRVILATGGASYPRTGSTGDGYYLAESLGHTIIPIRPALVPLVVEGAICYHLAGLDLRNINVRLLVGGKRKKEAFGEISFLDNSVSGPVILTLSSMVVDLLREGKQVALSLDLKPALEMQKLDARLIRDFEKRHREHFSSVLRGLLPAQLIPLCLEATGISGKKEVGQITASERRQLRIWLKDFRLPISGHRPFTEAIVTAGGVDLRQVNPRTMESKLIQGLYLAGEVLDLQGDTGGYNLQAAFSTGWLAGTAAGQSVAEQSMPLT